MGKKILKSVWYLFVPEESPRAKWPIVASSLAGRKNFARVSFKAIFWTWMAVGTALMLGRLS